MALKAKIEDKPPKYTGASKEEIDKALKKLEAEHRTRYDYLKPDAREIERCYGLIEQLKVAQERAEKTMQDRLKSFHDHIDDLPTFELENGFTITHAQTRKIEIDSPRDFLKWLKENCNPKEVLEFFETALKSSEVKKFADKQCDKQRRNGIIEPKIDGLTIHEPTYRRLTTFYKGDTNGSSKK